MDDLRRVANKTGFIMEKYLGEGGGVSRRFIFPADLCFPQIFAECVRLGIVWI
jgi:hypothetical protein